MYTLDVSTGDPIKPFEYAARQGFEKLLASGKLGKYDNYGHYVEDICETIAPYMQQRVASPLQEMNCKSSHLALTNGVTHGFVAVLEHLKKGMEFYSRLTGAEPYKPVIIMPTPTYGIFGEIPEKIFDRPVTAQDLKENENFRAKIAPGVEVVFIDRDPDKNWQVDPAKLDALIETIHQDPKKCVIAYYDSNPNNPTGRVRGKEETEALLNVIIKHQNLPRPGMREAEAALNYPQNAIRYRPKLNIIEDAIYDGLEMGDEKAHFFLSSGICDPNRAYLLMGGSKVGLAALRAGVVYCSATNAGEVRSIVKSHQYFPPLASAFALETLFSTDPKDVAEREAHLATLREEHRFSGLLMKALFNGIGDVTVTDGERSRMIEAVANFNRTSEQDAAQRLERGIEGARIITDPESGFFHLIDCNALKDRHYHAALTCNPFHRTLQPSTSKELMQAFISGGNVQFCQGSYCGSPDEELILRGSFAFPPETIVDMANRTETAIGHFKKHEGEVTPVRRFQQKLQR